MYASHSVKNVSYSLKMYIKPAAVILIILKSHSKVVWQTTAYFHMREEHADAEQL